MVQKYWSIKNKFFENSSKEFILTLALISNFDCTFIPFEHFLAKFEFLLLKTNNKIKNQIITDDYEIKWLLLFKV
jgi:hypothetical protein